MTAMPITLGAAGILGLIYAVLTTRVFAARFRSGIMLGTGPTDEKLQIAVRAHANFAEYVPLILLLLGGGGVAACEPPAAHRLGCHADPRPPPPPDRHGFAAAERLPGRQRGADPGGAGRCRDHCDHPRVLG